MILAHLVFFDFFRGATASSNAPVPAAQEAAGGGGYAQSGFLYPRRKKKKPLDGLWEELYAAVYGLEPIPEARPALRKALEPYARTEIQVATKYSVPPLPEIDFSALRRDLHAVGRIIEAYQKFQHEEDEDYFLLAS